jgi:hypothetical protein
MITVERTEEPIGYSIVRATEKGYTAHWDGPKGDGYALFRYPHDALLAAGFEPCGIRGENQYEYAASAPEPKIRRRSRSRRHIHVNPRHHRRSSDCTLVALALAAIGFLVGRATK